MSDEGIQRAASTIQSAAEQMSRTQGYLDESLRINRDHLREDGQIFLARLEEILMASTIASKEHADRIARGLTSHATNGLLDDPREIESAWGIDDNGSWRVGTSGITKIEVYAEMGQFGPVPWLRIFVGESVSDRTPAAAASISYAPEDRGATG